VKKVLRRRSKQRNAADVDILDGILQGHARLSNRFLKGIQIADDDVDGRITILAQIFKVFLTVTRENARVDSGVKCFDTPAKKLVDAGKLFHAGDGQPRLSQCTFCTAAGDQIVTVFHEGDGEIYQSGFVINAQE